METYIFFSKFVGIGIGTQILGKYLDTKSSVLLGTLIKAIGIIALMNLALIEVAPYIDMLLRVTNLK